MADRDVSRPMVSIVMPIGKRHDDLRALVTEYASVLGDAGKEFEIEVIADEVRDLMLIHLILVFEPAQLQALEAIPGESLQGSNPPAFFEEIDNSRGVVDISISTITIVSRLDETPSISGMGRIATIRFKALSAGVSSVVFHGASEFRDSTNNSIGIVSKLGSVIDIVE